MLALLLLLTVLLCVNVRARLMLLLQAAPLLWSVLALLLRLLLHLLLLL